MTLPISGLITAEMINIELGKAPGEPFNIDAMDNRELAEIPTGPISFSDFYGKSDITINLYTMTTGYINIGLGGGGSLELWGYSAANAIGSLAPGTNFTFDGISSDINKLETVENDGDPSDPGNKLILHFNGLQIPQEAVGHIEFTWTGGSFITTTPPDYAYFASNGNTEIEWLKSDEPNIPQWPDGTVVDVKIFSA